jgi:hypothetical protein
VSTSKIVVAVLGMRFVILRTIVTRTRPVAGTTVYVVVAFVRISSVAAAAGWVGTAIPSTRAAITRRRL